MMQALQNLVHGSMKMILTEVHGPVNQPLDIESLCQKQVLECGLQLMDHMELGLTHLTKVADGLTKTKL
jgi:hypothetical protein